VVHDRLVFHSDGERIVDVEFKDLNGFQMVIPATNLRLFVTSLAQSLLASAQNASTN
jgi:hypothetical protein